MCFISNKTKFLIFSCYKSSEYQRRDKRGCNSSFILKYSLFRYKTFEYMGVEKLRLIFQHLYIRKFLYLNIRYFRITKKFRIPFYVLSFLKEKKGLLLYRAVDFQACPLWKFIKFILLSVFIRSNLLL